MNETRFIPRPLAARAVAVVAAATLALAACGQAENVEEDEADGGGTAGEGSDGGSGEQVQLRFYWWGADARAQLTEEVVALFEEQNPDIDIVPQWGTWDGYWDRLATQTAAGDTPDVLQMDESQIATYSAQGVLHDLQEIDSLDLSEIEDPVLRTGEVDGAITGAPVGIGIFSMGVNPEILDRAGVELPDETTWTWDEFADLAVQVSEALGDEGVTGFDWFGLQSSELGAFVRQHGEEVFPREGETPVSQETLEQFYEFALELVESGAAQQPSGQVETVGASLEQQPFGTNTTAFHLLFHTQIQAFVDASGSNLELWRLPAPEAGADPRMVNKASMYWSVAERTAHPEEAGRFVDFLLNDEEAAKILLVERGVPGIPRIQEAIAPELNEIGQMATEFANEMQDEVVDPPQVTPDGAGDFGNQVQRLGSAVLFGQSTPAEAAQELLAAIEQVQND